MDLTENEATYEQIALEIKNELQNNFIPYNQMYCSCVQIYIDKGYDMQDFSKVWKYLKTILPVLSTNNNEGSQQIISSDINKVWTGSEAEYTQLQNYQNNTLYLITN